MEQESNPLVEEHIFSRLSLQTTWLEQFRERLSEPPPRGKPEYVFRAAGPTSSGINAHTGMKAGMYVDLAMDEIPTFEEVGTPETRQSYCRKRIEDETSSHLKKYERLRTGWISTTSSLLRALQILFFEHREQGQLFVLRTAACKDIFSAPELRDNLPGLQNIPYLSMKSGNEFLIRGKVEEHAIVGCATVKSLQDHNLDIIAPGLSNPRQWWENKYWEPKFFKSYPSDRQVSDELLDTAVALAFAFDMEDKSIMVRRFLSRELCIRSEGLDDDQMWDRIKKKEILENWFRAGAEFAQALKNATEAIQRYTQRVGNLTDQDTI